MAVGMNLLGRNVRCPHCKAVVQAPTAAGEPMSSPGLGRVPMKAPELKAPEPMAAPLPQFKLPEKETEAPESIFGEVHEEDLFGTEPPKPTMLPPRLPSPAPAPTIEMQTPEPVHVPEPIYTELLPYSPTGPTVAMPVPDLGFGDTEAFSAPPPSSEQEAPAAREPRRTQRPPTADEGKGSNAFAIILLAYGLLMTIAAGVFGYLSFSRSSEPEHPFKAIPDVYGEYEKANRKQTSFKWMPDAKAEVPADLRVKMGDELVVGDLSVKPVSVGVLLETNVVDEYVSGPDKDRNIGNTLLLTLKVKNLSDDVTFYPTDPAFLRELGAKKDEKTGPYTALQINREMYYGPFSWPPSGNVRKQYIKGQESNEKPLKPHEERDIFVTVAPKQSVVRELDRVPVDQTLLWRVQLRRGMVKYKDDSGKDGEISATTVIGVTFTRKQIQ